MKNILLTGASGFIGQRFVPYNASKYNIKSVSLQRTQVDAVDFEGIDAIVHLAGKAHQMTAIDDQIYFDVNCHLTTALAAKAKAAGVAHFVFVSTVKVFGEETSDEIGLLETSDCHASDPYGKSKLQAEEALKKMESADFTIGVVRPPLVYGPGVKGNMLRLLKLAQSGKRMPFAGIENRRSMVFLDNLIELINTVVDQKASGIFHAGDKQAISTSNLVEMINSSMNNKARMMRLNGILLGGLKLVKPGLVQRLWGSFVINTKQTNQALNFTPPYDTADGIRQMVEWYKATNRANT